MAANLLKPVLFVILFSFITINALGQYATEVLVVELGNERLKNSIEKNASKLLTEFNKAFFEDRVPVLDDRIVTQQARNTILLLWETSHFRCFETELFERVAQRHNQNEFELRNIPLFFKEAFEGENYEEGVFVFNSQGKIDNFYISIGTNRANEILREANNVTDFRRRQIVLDFMENFRTSYNRRDIDFLEKVFSEDALIISGVIRTIPQNHDLMGANMNNTTIEYTRRSKTEYINHMRRIFRINDYINIRFSEVEVMQHGRYPEIYGVTVKQNWNTTRYSDVGYVFLMIDFKDDENPIIHVRTWQPEEYIVGGGEVFSLGSFGNYNR